MGSKQNLVSRSEDDGSEESVEEIQLNLERSIKELYQEDSHQQGDPKMLEAKKVELMSKLEEAREDEAGLERMARRMAWRRNVKREMKINAELKEILEEVPLEEMEEEEKLKLLRLSVKWREALKSERGCLLFPQVLDTLMKSTGPICSTVDVLDYRLVSKASNGAVYTLLPMIVAPQMWTDEFYGRPYTGITKFDNSEGAKAFMRKFSQAVNPFFTRNIDVFMTTSNSSDFLPVIEDILRRWGKELWSAKLYVFRRMAAEPLYDLLVTWLKLMPNLRSLRLDITISDCTQSTPDASLAKLWKHIQLNPLPNLPHLGHISINSTKPGPVSHAILSKFSTSLEKVEVEFEKDDLQINDTISNCSSPTPLTSEGSFLAMQQLSACYGYLVSVEDVRKIIQNFNNWHLPLRQLKLTLSIKNKYEKDDFYPSFLLDNKSLTCKGAFLELPQLEELFLTFSEGIDLRTLDFLLPCKAMRVLSISLVNTGKETNCEPETQQQPEDNGIFKFPADPADKDIVYQSLIWKLFPELKMIVLVLTLFRKGVFKPDISSYQYTREEYAQQKKTGE